MPTGSPTTPISEAIGIPIADDTLVHFAPEAHNPVYVSGYQSYWVKYGNVNDWTPLQIRYWIGLGTTGGSENGTRIIHIKINADGAFGKYGPTQMSIPEYINKTPVHVKTIEIYTPD